VFVAADRFRRSLDKCLEPEENGGNLWEPKDRAMLVNIRLFRILCG